MPILFTEPVSGGSPCGADTKYDDDYLAIEAEIDKSNSISEGAATDWNVVCSGCEALLSGRTRDIKLAAWWTYGRYKTQGLSSLLESLETLDALLQHFGKELFPRSGKAKFNALMWLEGVLNAALISERTIAIPAPQAEAYLTLFKNLQEHAVAACEVDGPLFKDACRMLDAIVTEENKRREESEKPKPSAPSQPSGNALNEIGSDADVAKVLNGLKKSTELLSSYWRGSRMDDLRALRLTRMICWLEIEGLPDAQNGKTALNPPSAERVELIDTLTQEGRYAEAFESIETMLLRAPFWLEGHFRASKILEAAGNARAASEVKHMLAWFVKSNEGITELNFADGTPFAPLELKSWLADAVAGNGIPMQAEEVENTDSFEAIEERCYALLKKKNAKEAMQLLHKSHAGAGTKEDKFKWRLLHAEVAVEAGKPEMGLALIEELEKDVQRYRLEEWRPDLAAEVYALLLNSFNRNLLEREKLEASYRSLCRLDTAGAIDIKLH